MLVVSLHYTSIHVTADTLERGLGFLSFIPRTGWTGVSLFFVLSSFLLSRPFWVERAGGRTPALSTFYYRRVIRIVPLFYLAVLVACLWTGEGWAAIRSMLFLPDYGVLSPFSEVWWSLRTEAQFYLILGLGIWLLRKPKWRPICFGALAFFMVGYLMFLSGSLEPIGWSVGLAPVSVLMSVAHQWPAFAGGILISWLYVEWGDSWRESAAQSKWLRHGGGDAVMLSILFALGFALWSVESVLYIPMIRMYGAWPLIQGGLWASFVLALLVLPLYTRRLFVNAPLEFFGRISYSLYLIHYPVSRFSLPLRIKMRVWLADTNATQPELAAVGLLLVFTIAVALSWLSYRCVEMPFATLKDRFAKSRAAS